MFLIPPSPRLRRFHVHSFNLLSIGLLCLKSRILTSFILKTEISLLKKGWSKGVMRRLWFYELFDAVLFTASVRWWNCYFRVFLNGKGRALFKRGVVCGTSVFRTESVGGKQRKDFYVVSYNDEPCLEMVIFLYLPSVLVWKCFIMDVGGGEIRTCITCCLRDIQVMETAKQSSIYKSK